MPAYRITTILCDLIGTFADKQGNIYNDINEVLKTFSQQKILLTSATNQQLKDFKLTNLPYPVYTTEHTIEKSNPEYYKKLLKQFNLTPQEVIYIERKHEAIKTAQMLGIKTIKFNPEKRNINTVRKLLQKHLNF